MFSINYVGITNFRSFRGQHTFILPQTPGLYLLTGRNEDESRLGTNACGKSTLLDAIYWCLYGRTTRGLKAGDVITWGEKNCSVTVEITVGSQTSAIHRAQNPNLLSIGDTEASTQAEIDEILRLKADAFTYSVMLPQFGEPFFDLKPSEKLALFSQILGLDYWLDRSQEAKALAAELSCDVLRLEHAVTKAQGQIELLTTSIRNLEGLQQTFVADQKARITTQKATHAALVKQLDKARFNKTLTYKAVKGYEAKIKLGPALCSKCNQPLPSEERTAWERNLADFRRQLSREEREEATLQAEVGAAARGLDEEQTNPYTEQINSAQTTHRELTKLTSDHQTELSILSKDYEALEFWVDGFKRVRLFLVERVLRELEVSVNNSLVSLGLTNWCITLDVERENKSGGVTKGFVVNIQARSCQEPVRWEAFSGGEGQRLRLAGDLGLANLIMDRAGLRNTIEFYDEPSRHLSQEGLLDVAETLHQRALNDEKVIFLVDHNTIDFGNFAGTFVVSKDSRGSRLT